MTEWFESWFNTEEYLQVYRHRNEKEACLHVDFILENVKIPPHASILDMACGPGRHSIIFARKGYEVTAVDLSEKLLCVASTAAAKECLQIDFFKSDLRKINLNRQFDIIINLFTSFGYFENDDENYRIFDVALRHLKYNGKFVIDYMNKNYVTQNLREYSEDVILNSRIIQKRQISGNRVIKNIEIESSSGKKNFYESVRMFSPSELIDALNDRGLFVDRIFGDFDGTGFDPEKSERIIIFAVK